MNTPFSPDFQTLSGQLNLKLEKGRLLEVNSSAAQILNVLSLQSLFKFATLDLQGSVGNLVSKGTAFNTINTTFNIQNGYCRLPTQSRQFYEFPGHHFKGPTQIKFNMDNRSEFIEIFRF